MSKSESANCHFSRGTLALVGTLGPSGLLAMPGGAQSPYNNRMLTVDPHPLLDLRAFETVFPRPLGEMKSSLDLLGLLSLTGSTPFQSDETTREAVRKLLRHDGFKPAGRSKPASEYLIKAVADGRLGSINVAVDACNVVSLHSGLPISVVDLDRTRAPLRVGVAPVGTNYVFNASGQTIELAGMLCLFDADGPCGCAVKDAQRTKTGPETRRTLSVIWGATALPGPGGTSRDLVSCALGKGRSYH